ncbi:MAG: glucose-6-phosphate isomerase [Acidaminococcaceae bacterium]|jgi:glucose-6-phosphate isomerase|nr:glucose-6-phosphate isomerase [Acidaminococcaceae bacterium]MCI2109421.1 glucose-6-phosphate isomerase [Acidaminococcaceae bacterium]
MSDTEKRITLQSGFYFDYTNMLGQDRIQPQDFAEAKKQLDMAEKNIAKMRATGISTGHLSKDGTPEHVYFPRLPYIKEGNPNTPDLIKELKNLGETIRKNRDVVIFCGIGGSFLGGKVLYDCYTNAFWDRKPDQEGTRMSGIYFSGNNVDAEQMDALWHQLLYQAQRMNVCQQYKLRVTLIPISKSGTTLETTAAFLYFYQKLSEQPDMFEVDAAVVTDKGNKQGPLNMLAQKYHWPMFDVVEGIGGRFSVLSTPGLIVAAVLGMDMDKLLLGAADMDAACVGADPQKNPALMNAFLKYVAGAKYNRNIEVMMPYGMCLKSLSEWYVQLLAESLGKKKNRAGQDVFYGRTPVPAIGTTDMHSQTQLHQEGRKDKVIQFLTVGDRRNKIILGKPFPDIPAYAKYAGLDVDKALSIAQEANEEALTSDNRFNAKYYLPKLDEYFLGQIFFFLMLSIAYEGELAQVDAYDQPGVEIYKRIMKSHL